MHPDEDIEGGLMPANGMSFGEGWITSQDVGNIDDNDNEGVRAAALSHLEQTFGISTEPAIDLPSMPAEEKFQDAEDDQDHER